MRKQLILLMVAASAACAPYAMAHPAHGSDKQFAMMDADKDGKVSASEHATSAKAMFDKMDGNKDGTVTPGEMTAARKAITGTSPKKSDLSSQDKIKVVDGNADGKLTAAEHATASESMFATMDTDKDGFLSHQEMAAGHAAMLKKH